MEGNVVKNLSKYICKRKIMTIGDLAGLIIAIGWILIVILSGRYED